MVVNKKKIFQFSGVYLGKRPISEIYLSKQINNRIQLFSVWSQVSSCFSGEEWQDTLKWSDEDAWTTIGY